MAGYSAWTMFSSPACSQRGPTSHTGTQYTVHSTQYTIHNTQYTIHNTQYTVHNTQYTIHSTQIHSTQCTVRSTQYTVHNIQYTVRSSTINNQHVQSYCCQVSMRFHGQIFRIKFCKIQKILLCHICAFPGALGSTYFKIRPNSLSFSLSVF